MKSTILIFCLTLLASQLTEATTDTAVLDSSGDEVQPGVDYYIVSVFRPGGGLTLGGRNGTCPLSVMQERFQGGLPVRFFPVDPKAKVVTLNTDTNVAVKLLIPIPPLCLPSRVWKLRADEGTRKLYVGVGGKIGNPGPDTLANWFKIEKVGPHQVYKFIFNPDVHVDYEIIAGDLGISFESDGRWLGLSEPPFLFVLKKA